MRCVIHKPVPAHGHEAFVVVQVIDDFFIHGAKDTVVGGPRVARMIV
jgi:hypothetical protein